MPQNERPASFTGRQEAALRSLLADGSTRKAATAAGVNPSTVRRWLADPRFRDEHRCRARLLADEALSDLLAAQKAAVATLREALTAGTAATKVRAARALLDLGARETHIDPGQDHGPEDVPILSALLDIPEDVEAELARMLYRHMERGRSQPR